MEVLTLLAMTPSSTYTLVSWCVFDDAQPTAVTNIKAVKHFIRKRIIRLYVSEHTVRRI